jgi:hypothetical protein
MQCDALSDSRNEPAELVRGYEKISDKEQEKSYM